jgi:hypothetical protein
MVNGEWWVEVFFFTYSLLTTHYSLLTIRYSPDRKNLSVSANIPANMGMARLPERCAQPADGL